MTSERFMKTKWCKLCLKHQRLYGPEPTRWAMVTKTGTLHLYQTDRPLGEGRWVRPSGIPADQALTASLCISVIVPFEAIADRMEIVA